MTEQNAGTRGVIVVGVDGSKGSEAALRWAVHQAEVTGAKLEAVTAWELPVTFAYAMSYDDIDWGKDAEQALDQTLAKVLTAEHTVPVTRQVVRGHPANVLVEASRGADLLVVGSRGHGTVVGMLLGSVSHHCVLHADCPVVVTHTPPEPPAPRR